MQELCVNSGPLSDRTVCNSSNAELEKPILWRITANLNLHFPQAEPDLAAAEGEEGQAHHSKQERVGLGNSSDVAAGAEYTKL